MTGSFLLLDQDCDTLVSMTGLKFLVFENYRPDSVRMPVALSNAEGCFVDMLAKGQLREIHFWSIALLDLRDREWREFGSILRRVKAKARQQARQLRIYFTGLEIDRLHDLVDFESRPLIRRTSLIFKEQLDAYLVDRSMESLPFLLVNYDVVQNCISSHILTARNLPKLKVVVVSEPVTDELAFVQWLKSLKTLTAIRFGVHCDLSPEFFSHTLPTVRPNLETIHLSGQREDFSFLLKFKLLFSVYFDGFPPDYDLVELLFSSLTHLTYLEFFKAVDGLHYPIAYLATLKLKNKYRLHFLVNQNKPATKMFESFESFVQFTRNPNFDD